MGEILPTWDLLKNNLVTQEYAPTHHLANLIENKGILW